MNDYWCIPLKEDANFVACMEDVLDVYELPYNPKYPVVCMDEKPYQLLVLQRTLYNSHTVTNDFYLFVRVKPCNMVLKTAFYLFVVFKKTLLFAVVLDGVREPLLMRLGNNQKIDFEYKRNGTCSIFAFVEPLGGIHHVSVHEHRTAIDWAKEIKYLSGEMFPEAEKIILVMDNLNTHKASSVYKAFEPAEARRIIKRLEIHYTPKHGSWLNMAEIELNVMTRQCLSRRISTIDKLKSELSAWEAERNGNTAKIKWHFQTGNAREKLISLYLVIPSVTS